MMGHVIRFLRLFVFFTLLCTISVAALAQQDKPRIKPVSLPIKIQEPCAVV